MKKIFLLVLLFCSMPLFAGHNALLRVKTNTGKTFEIEKIMDCSQSGATIKVSKDWLLAADVATLEIVPDFAKAKAGDCGYYVFPDGMLGKFGFRKNGEYALKRLPMAMSGMKTPSVSFVSIIKSGRFESLIVAKVVNGNYEMFHRFDYTQSKPYEDIVLDYVFLKGKDADYSGMARVYRNYQLARGEVVPLKERIKSNPELAYAARSPEVRIRQGWKPVPTPVPEQSIENEPEMKSVVAFGRVGDIIDEFKRQGVDEAELCLVGWNSKGHDGRWPTPFPVEKSLGGESALRALIKKAQSQGYQIVCHTNSSDSYRISPDWSEDVLAKQRDGSFVMGGSWSAGTMYHLCFEESYYKFTTRDLPKIADLGFKGLHYIDVISTINPIPCFDMRHPINGRQAAEYATLMLDCAKRNFGGAASEGGYDFTASRLDYALYITFNLTSKRHPMIDDYVPVWHLVYNGIILSNPASATINWSIKKPEVAMKVIEYGARPSYYFYSAFRDDGKNWMGVEDLRCGTDAELKEAVAEIKKGSELLKKMGYLQFEYFDSHNEIAPKVFKSEFSDGSVIICNYSDDCFEYKNSKIPSMGYRLFKPIF